MKYLDLVKIVMNLHKVKAYLMDLYYGEIMYSTYDQNLGNRRALTLRFPKRDQFIYSDKPIIVSPNKTFYQEDPYKSYALISSVPMDLDEVKKLLIND